MSSQITYKEIFITNENTPNFIHNYTSLIINKIYI